MKENLPPTYNLEQLKLLLQHEETRVITKASYLGAVGLGFVDINEIIKATLTLTYADFYKTMEAKKMPGLWQDVYKKTIFKQKLYIKLQLSSSKKAVVISFKEDTS